MTDTAIRQICNAYYRELKRSDSGLSANPDAESIHRFRVVYKKLRAFLRMMAYMPLSPESFKVPRKLKQLYTITGTLRNLQLQLQYIKEAMKYMQPKPLVYLRLLETEIKKLQPELTDVLSARPVAMAKKNTWDYLPGKFTLTAYRNYTGHKWDTIAAIILRGGFSDDNIHFIRKGLKDLYYNLELYEGVEREKLFVSTWKGMTEPEVESLLNGLGIFQDHCTAIALMKDYWLSSFQAVVRDQLSRLKNERIREKLRHKKELVRQLKLLPAVRIRPHFASAS
jgi:CHAD domain-containing protein